jgi:hypothetical protein
MQNPPVFSLGPVAEFTALERPGRGEHRGETPHHSVQDDATMDHRPDLPRQTWQLTLDGSPKPVELVPYAGRLGGTPSSFRVGTVERKLEYSAGVSRWQRFKAPLLGSVDVGSRRVAMTLTTIRPSYRSAVRRNISGLKSSGPLSFIGAILGGAALSGGAAAAMQSTLVWLIYELSVDGEPSGSWVAKTVDGLAERWTFVPPGGSLPDSDTPDW